MIKIIKPGKIKHTMICPNCECEFEFEAEDVTWETVWDDHGGHYPAADWFTIECPYCKTQRHVKMDETLEREKDKMKRVGAEK